MGGRKLVWEEHCVYSELVVCNSHRLAQHLHQELGCSKDNPFRALRPSFSGELGTAPTPNRACIGPLKVFESLHDLYFSRKQTTQL